MWLGAANASTGLLVAFAEGAAFQYLFVNKLGLDVKLNTIVIIDDIYTTGSTIDAMTGVLNDAGVKNVYYMALTIGRGI